MSIPEPRGPFDLAFELHALASAMDSYARAYLRPLGITHPQFTTLVIMEECPGIRGSELAKIVKLSPAGVSKTLKVLFDLGFAMDTSRPGMGNVQQLETTAAGRALLRAAKADLAAPLHEACSRVGVDPEELSRQLHFISEVADGFAPPERG